MGQGFQEWTMSKQIISLQIFKRLSPTNFTSSILEYFDPNGQMLSVETANVR